MDDHNVSSLVNVYFFVEAKGKAIPVTGREGTVLTNLEARPLTTRAQRRSNITQLSCYLGRPTYKPYKINFEIFKIKRPSLG
jgi:hypothetical protein